MELKVKIVECKFVTLDIKVVAGTRIIQSYHFKYSSEMHRGSQSNVIKETDKH